MDIADEDDDGGVEALLLEMKDTSELMVDLAYTSYIFHHETIAQAVYDLEDRLDRLQEAIQRRSVEEVQTGSMTPDRALVMMRLAQATEIIADSAQEIANVVLRDIPRHPVLEESVEEADVTIAAVDVDDGAKLDGATLGEARLASETGMQVVAVQRGPEWIYGPGKTTEIQAGDRLFARGPREGQTTLEDWCSTEP